MNSLRAGRTDRDSRWSEWYLLLLVTITLTIVGLESLSAQTIPSTELPPQDASPSSSALRFGGEIGTFGELYSISGQPKRRPSSTGRLFLRSTLTAWESVSASFNIMLSTEGNSARQDINQLDFNPRWRWGSAHVGDFTEELSPLTLSGVRIRGGALLISPAKFRLGLISGMANRAVETSGGSRAYERSITGARLGYGSEGGSSVDFIMVTGRDKLSSLAVPIAPDTQQNPPTGIDSTQFDAQQNPESVTPQENLVFAMVGRVGLLDRKLNWRNEIGASAITRDRRSAELDNSDVPGFLTDLFTPRKSSGADFAATSDVTIDLRRMSISAGFHYIGPGYVSLGVSSLMSDKREITTGMTYRFKSGMMRIDGAVQQDNLINQKSVTTDRRRVNAIMSYRLRPNWNTTVGGTYMNMANNALTDTTRLDYSNWILRTNQQITFRRQRGLRNVSLDLVYQQAADANPLRKAADVESITGTISGGLQLASSIEVLPSIGLISARPGLASHTLTQNYVVSARHTAMQRRLNSTATVSVGVGDVTTSIRPLLRSAYELRRNLVVSAEAETTSVMGGSASSRFNEYAGRLTLTRKF